MQAPLTTLKCVIFVHFTLTALATLGTWAPNCFVFVQIFYLALGLWGLLQSENPLPIEMMLTTNILSLILDIIVLSVSFPTRGEYGLPIPEGVSAGLAHATSGLSGVGRSRGPYQNIDPEPVIES